MMRSGARFSPPSRSIKVDGVPVKLNPRQFEQYSAEAGQQSRTALEALTTMPGWSDMPDDDKGKAIKKTVTGVRRSVRDSLFSDLGAPAVPPPPGFNMDQGKDSRPAAALPAGFKVDGESGGVNVYGDLQRQIPGLQITSGFRTPEYQADMRRRGYHPARATPT